MDKNYLIDEKTLDNLIGLASFSDAKSVLKIIHKFSLQGYVCPLEGMIRSRAELGESLVDRAGGYAGGYEVNSIVKKSGQGNRQGITNNFGD